MNNCLNDKDESVLAVGAPASFERVKVEWPQLISDIRDELASSTAYGYPKPDMVAMCRSRGIKSPMETNNIINAALVGTPYAWNGFLLCNSDIYEAHHD